jgi:hypothetical protein
LLTLYLKWVMCRVSDAPGMWEEVISAGEMLGLTREQLDAIVR